MIDTPVDSPTDGRESAAEHPLAPRLHHALAELALPVSSDAEEKLLLLIELLAKWNRTYNLTGDRGTEQILTRHVLDSLAWLPHVAESPAASLLDVGSGAGFPGVPVAVARPLWQVTVLDSNTKKAAFLNQARIDLDLPNVFVVPARVEDYHPPAPFDYVISRAFSDLAGFAAVAGRHLKPGGRLLALKGIRPEAELRELPQQWRTEAIHFLRVPGLEAARCLVVLSCRR